MKELLTTAILLMALSSVQATVINIPVDEPTIQAGIGAAVEGDTVLVAEGTYYERLNFQGKAITVGSLYLLDTDLAHISNTVINGDPEVVGYSDTGSVVLMVNGEGPGSVLGGFSITGAVDAERGGGIYVKSAAGPRIIGCAIAGNTATYAGGGIFVQGSAEIVDCSISGNTAGAGGGGFYGIGGHATISGGEIFEDNSAPQGSSVRLEAYQLTVEECDLWGGVYYEDVPADAALAVAESQVGLTIRHSELYQVTFEALYTNVVIDSSKLYVNHLTQCCGWGHDLSLTGDTLYNTSIMLFDNTTAYINECELLSTFLELNGSAAVLNQTVLTNSAIILDWNANLPYFRAENSTIQGIGIRMEGETSDFDSAVVDLTNCIVVTDGDPIYTGSGSLRLSCTDLFGFEGEDWYNSAYMELDTSFVYFEDPLFCGGLTLQSNSPCLPENNECGVLIGALGVGCSCCEVRGDFNHNGYFELLDLDDFISWLFRGGSEAFCMDEADADYSEGVDILDLEWLKKYLFDDGVPARPCE